MDALGMIETNSIPIGIQAGDAMLKTADVTLVTAQAVCAGKYIVIVSGGVAAVKSSVAAGVEASDYLLVDSIVIPNVENKVIEAMSACSDIENVDSLGIIETFSLSSAVICADAAVKAADIQLIEVRLGRGLGGKSFIILTGEVAAVKAAMEAARSVENVSEMVAATVVIPSPHPDILQAVY